MPTDPDRQEAEPRAGEQEERVTLWRWLDLHGAGKHGRWSLDPQPSEKEMDDWQNLRIEVRTFIPESLLEAERERVAEELDARAESTPIRDPKKWPRGNAADQGIQIGLREAAPLLRAQSGGACPDCGAPLGYPAAGPCENPVHGDRPSVCPACGSSDPAKVDCRECGRGQPRGGLHDCTDPWHGNRPSEEGS